MELLSRLKTRAFFALCQGQRMAGEGEIPILVYNPHPYTGKEVVECEFQLHDQNWEDSFSLPEIYHNDLPLPSQAEKEQSNLNLDWRKRVVFAAELEPGLNRFDCRLKQLPKKPSPQLVVVGGKITFQNERLEVIINCETGLIDRYQVEGVDYLKAGAFCALVLADNDDPWGMTVHGFRDVVGRFELMSPERGAAFSGVAEKVLDSVRVIEDGEVRSVVEAVLNYGDSFICMRYKLPKQGTELEIEGRVHWNEKSRMLKLSIPTTLADPDYLGQVAYGTAMLPNDGQEAVAQKWTGLFSEQDQRALTCINDGTYGSDSLDGEIRLSLLRSAAYAGHPILDRPILPQDRYSPRIDQGERLFRFWIKGGSFAERRASVDREALLRNEKPYALSFFPSGQGTLPSPAIRLSDAVVQMTAFKQAESGGQYIVRLFEPTGVVRSTVVEIPAIAVSYEVHLSAYEIKTLRIDPTQSVISETNLLE
ncbi:MAG: hypothetical protein GY759_10000 [Chloroflexi bacterium]|nr:hypothetical protein [Chloroflexota bacterium]